MRSNFYQKNVILLLAFTLYKIKHYPYVVTDTTRPGSR